MSLPPVPFFENRASDARDLTILLRAIDVLGGDGIGSKQSPH